jgi:hypothetical protein
VSMKTWRAEFYPITANQAAKRGPLAAAKHSLQKWLGTRKAALKRHGVELGCRRVVGKGVGLDLDSATCALCRYSDSAVMDQPNYFCDVCPYKITNGFRCESAYLSATNGEPADLIDGLRKTVKMLEREK